MAISYEQFTKVIRNDYARMTIGLGMRSEEVEFLLQDDAHLIAYFEEWSRNGQPRLDGGPRPEQSSGTTDNYSRAKRPFAQIAVWGFVLSMVSIFLIGIPLLGFLVGLAGAITSGSALGILREIRTSRRGWGLAVAGLIVGCVYTVINIFWLAGYSPNY